jgi:hypothetical protein
MRNNFFEETFLKQNVLDFHEENNSQMNIPDFALVDCPDCGEKISKNCVRSISLCLNARNVGDIAVEFHCRPCGISNTFYYDEKVNDSKEFSEFVSGRKEVRSEPELEEEMYASRRNNLMRKLEGKLGCS